MLIAIRYKLFGCNFKEIKMKIKKAFLVSIIFFALLVFAATSFGRDEIVYLKNNIHAYRGPRDRDITASYANWTGHSPGHILIPVNTPVYIGRYRHGFTLLTEDTGRKIFFQFNASQAHMNRSEYIGLITSERKTSIKNLSDIDQQGIKEGRAYLGMTKKAVRIALGYPAPHRTPSLESHSWVYWTNRWKTMLVEFNRKGKVIYIR